MSREKSNIINKLSRRKILQIISLIGGGFVVAFVAKKVLQKRKLVSEIITVDASGNIINRQPLNAKYFIEDLSESITLEMAEIPGGEFIMGSPENEQGRNDNESPQHNVSIKRFFMSKFAITQAQYQEIMDDNPSKVKGEKYPVEQIGRYSATKFCEKLTEKTGRRYRLPSEAEWEYACRAGTNTPFYFGETITTDLANYNGKSTYADAPKGKYGKQIIEVGSFAPNAFGLYDMHGNVWELCQDNWHENYNDAPNDGSAWINEGLYDDSIVMRGGSWYSSPVFCRCAVRNYIYKDNSIKRVNGSIGFRVVCDSAPKALL